jgi:hypothetical protein
MECVNIDICYSNAEARYCDRDLYTASSNLEHLDRLMARTLVTGVLAMFIYKEEVC